jgi:hypothetical protein
MEAIMLDLNTLSTWVHIQATCDAHKISRRPTAFRLWPARDRPGSRVPNRAAQWGTRLLSLINRSLRQSRPHSQSEIIKG